MSCRGGDKGCAIPIIRDKHHELSGRHDCKGPKGGQMTIKPPIYSLEVTNPPDDKTFLPGS